MQLEQRLAEHVARARRELAEAIERHTSAMEKVARVEQRITACQQRQRAITAARLEGEGSPQEAAEFVALSGDIETLSGMLTAARQEAAAAQPHAQRANLAEAERQIAKHQAEVELDAVRAKAAEIEALFLRSIAAVHAAAKRSGHVRLGDVWQPSSPLVQLIHFGRAPEL